MAEAPQLQGTPNPSWDTGGGVNKGVTLDFPALNQIPNCITPNS
jgi:hypothetical protein